MAAMDNLMNNKAVMLGLAVLAFLVAAVLVIMIFRMLFGGRLRMPGGRARQARLGIVDAFDLDRQRQLIIVRRDNTEHLIMIGGPNDVVIESEIIRAEARDVRDNRRDPVLGSGLAEPRIPAPAPALPRHQGPQAGPPSAPAEVPSPISAPSTNSLPVSAPPMHAPALSAAEPPRAPTFPLPPRRPPAPPERRAPPQLPESVSRGDEVPSLSGQPVALAPAPPVPTLPPEPVASPPAAAPLPPPPATAPPPAAGPAAAPPSAPPRRPPFLKPLVSRPPIRPLQRTTAQGAQTSAPVAPAAGQVSPMPAPPSPAPPPPAAETPPSPRPVQAPPPPATQVNANDDSRDALESLEEEMAKLLGRGS